MPYELDEPNQIVESHRLFSMKKKIIKKLISVRSFRNNLVELVA